MNSNKPFSGFCGSEGIEEFSSNEFLIVNNCGVLKRHTDTKLGTPYLRVDHTIIYLTEGEGMVLLNGVKYKLTAGDLLYFPSNTKMIFSFDQGSQHYWIHFTGTGVEDLIAKSNIIPNKINHIGINLEICIQFSEIILSIFKSKKNNHFSIISSFYKILHIAYLNINKTPQINVENNIIDKAKLLMTTEFWKNNSIPYYAEKCNCSVASFNEHFKKATGLTPIKFITFLRIEQAKLLLTSTDHSIKQIANTIGYSDPLYFSKIFVQYCNISPKEYRKLATDSNRITI